MGVEYDGSGFCGWQIQPQGGVRTVQACVEQALSCVADQGLRVHCAGRTDTGVHGLGQVIHFDCPVERSMHSWVFGANANLPTDVSILWAQQVDTSFHARFSALRRRYRYIIFNRRVRPAVAAKQVSWEYRPLDEERMAQAARSLLGEHDFSSFRAYACQAKHPVRTIHDLTVQRQGEQVVIDIEANAFLHHMVRNIAGVLIAIGAGERDVSWVDEVLAARDRQYGGVTASPQGLTLVNVGYPDEYGLPVA
jgi:tRNA pseudouridine38-40 synthase